MTTRTRRRSVTLWIAIFAILLAALAPSLVRAVSSSGTHGLPWLETCTAAGLVTLLGDDTAPTPAEKSVTPHCPWCKLQAQLGLPLLATLAIHLALSTVDSPPVSTDPPGRQSHISRFAAPRGPPEAA